VKPVRSEKLTDMYEGGFDQSYLTATGYEEWKREVDGYVRIKSPVALASSIETPASGRRAIKSRNGDAKQEVIFCGATVRRYADPVHVLQTDRAEAVAATLHQADDALQAGYSIAGYLTYEAGVALEGITIPPLKNGEPLLAIGVYAGPSATLLDKLGARAKTGPMVTAVSRARYESDLARIAHALHNGDVYQVNYTVPFDFTCTGDPLALFNEIRLGASVPYAAYVRHGTRAYASLSPELFIEIDGTRIRTKPMKGTSVDARDLGSAKNRAEHLMIVDLVRNDLHKLCDDVRVPRQFEVERFPTFVTMTSTLEGTLKEGRRLDDIFAAMFPCGSITGAPKRSAIREIAACEAAPRGIAMGTIGSAMHNDAAHGTSRYERLRSTQNKSEAPCGSVAVSLPIQPRAKNGPRFSSSGESSTVPPIVRP